MADDDAGGRLVATIADATTAGLDIHGHDVLKTAPRGYPRDHPRIDLLRNKGLVAWTEWPAGAWLGRASAKDRVVKFFRDAKPLNEWLTAHVGPSAHRDSGP